MQQSVLLATLALLAGTLSTPLLAGDRDQNQARPNAMKTRPASGYDHAMQEVPNNAEANQRSHGWRYFSDPSTVRAVVISPQGDYYFSRGKGLHWIAAAQTGA